MTGSLSAAQVEEYDHNGYLVLPGLISAQELDDYNQRFLAIVEGEISCADGMKIMRDVMVVKGAVAPATPVHAVNKLLCLEEDPRLFAFVRHPMLVGAIQSLLGETIYSLASNVFNKPPGVDGRHPMHQDLRYFKLSPADGIVGVWTAMLPATRASGCLAVLPGSHKGDLLPHANPDWEFVNHGFYGIDQLDLASRVHVELQPGDTLLFHPLLIHGSGRNRSDNFRRAISVHYAADRCTSPKDDWRQNTFTRQIA
ncbi:MAG: phytanoyl-CoA dioxygenase family protein [Pseudomonadota bacterium]